MYSTQKIGTFAVVEARNAPCPMEWGCPKDRSMTVVVIPSQYSYFNVIPSVGVEMILVALLSLYYKYCV